MGNTSLVFDGINDSRIATSTGPRYEWHEPGWGIQEFQVEQSFASIEVTAIGTSAGTDVVSPDLLGTARSVLTSAAFMPGCGAFELRYVVNPSGPARVRLYLTAKSELAGAAGRDLAAAAVSAGALALPAGFSRSAVTPPCVNDPSPYMHSIFELRREEQVTFPQWDYIPAEFYYQVDGSPGDGTSWGNFFQALANANSELTISLLFQQTEIHPVERNVLGAITTDLSLIGSPRRDVNLIGQEMHYPACENAQSALQSWQTRLQLLPRPVLARVALCGAPATALPVASALAGAIATSSDGNHVSTPMWVDAPQDGDQASLAQQGFTWLDVIPWGGIQLWEHAEAPHSLRRFPYLYGLDEAAGLAVLPVSDDQGVPGFARSRTLEARRAFLPTADLGPVVTLGRHIHEGRAVADAGLPLSSINRHVLVVGTPGAGKTTTVLTLLGDLWRQHRVPFLVIEPTKSEYRTLLDAEGFDELRVICLGRDDIAPIRLNPLLPPPGVRCEVQANALLAALKAALPLPPPLPQLLEAAIERAYLRSGWQPDTRADAGLQPPSLRTVIEVFEQIYEEAGYVGEARNVASAMRVRLTSLLRGSRGRMLDTVESIDFASLLERPVVIELDEVADGDDKAVMAALILDRVRAGARAAGSTSGQLRHVTVVEEAHRLLARPETGAVNDDGPGARASGVEAFASAIAELRSYGEGFVLSSQSPSRLAAAAVDNCSTRILHRLESAADRDAVLTDADASDRDRDIAARLRPGEALVKWPPMDDPELLLVTPGNGVDSGRPVSDEHVMERMASETAAARSLMPYSLCTRDICPTGCSPSVRFEGHAIAEEIRSDAQEIWETAKGSAETLPVLADLLLNESPGDERQAYCSAAHLAAYGYALNVRRNVDIRSRVAQTIRERAQ